MWTAKRILIMVCGLLVSVSGFAVYTLFLGGIDGLPPLPNEFYPATGPEPLPPGPSEADLRLEQAFGSGCEELRRPYRLWLRDKGVAFAAGQFDIGTDGRVRLAPFSVAMYHKNKGPGAFPEISTIRSDVAYLTLDKPVLQAHMAELSTRKVIAVELQGKHPGISITNNRGTLKKSDDVDIQIDGAPLFYEERRNLIWTDGVVSLKDLQTNPPTSVRGRCLEMLLAKDAGPNRPRNAGVQPAGKTNDNAGVERIILRYDVDMHIWTSGDNGFLGGSQDSKKPAQAGGASAQDAPPAKAHLHIKTGGSFDYDLIKDFARFESPQNRDTKNLTSDVERLAPDEVAVQRFKEDGTGKFDHLVCDRLDLQFRRKVEGATAGSGSTGGDKEIQTAKATTRPGNVLVVVLDSDRMEAYGNYLFFRNGDALNGAETTLKGEPLHSCQNGNKMVSADLKLVANNKAGVGQYVEATGPGQIDLLDTKNPDKATYPTHILWRDKLVAVKDREGTQTFDLMKLYGDASFEDNVQKQQLRGERIFVWLRNSREAENKQPQASGASKQEIHRVVAQEQVRASSPDFIVKWANALTLTFVPETAQYDRLPATLSVANSPDRTPDRAPTLSPGSGATPQSAPATPSNGPLAAPPQEEKKPNPPIQLTANDITVAATTLGTKKQLQELIAKGSVFVYQAGDKVGEKRLDITGQLLTVKHVEGGDILTVHGEADIKKWARVEAATLKLYGPVVRINQADNRADVDGAGAMEMPSNTNLDGSKSDKPATRVRVLWNKNMTFDGREAYFHGGVQAWEKDSESKLLCDDMRVTLDRVVSFKEGQNQKDNAKMDYVMCWGKVYIHDIKLNERRDVSQWSILQGTEMKTDNVVGPTVLVGPGVVRYLAPGSAELNVASPPQNAGGNAVPEKLVWKLTQIDFPTRMFSQTKAANKNAKFWAEHGSFVEVRHFPFTPPMKADINTVMDPDHPPKDGFYMRCEILSVEGRQTGNKTTQYMVGERNVFFRTDQYYGHANIVTYNEATEIVVFEAAEGSHVLLYQNDPAGPRQLAFKSRKVLYNRKTGEMKAADVTSLSNGQ